MPKVRLFYEGCLNVEIDADPEDDEAWTEAVGKKWAEAAGITSVPHPADDVLESLELTGEEIIRPRPRRRPKGNT